MRCMLSASDRRTQSLATCTAKSMLMYTVTTLLVEWIGGGSPRRREVNRDSLPESRYYEFHEPFEILRLTVDPL